MCTRTVSALAHVFEQHGLSTVVLSSVKAQAEQLAPPRALHCDFPFGRPLGKPNEPDFQHGVLRAAFALLEREEGPVLEEFPEKIEDEGDKPLACPVPPRDDTDAHPAIVEAKGLRSAYERHRRRTGRTDVGRAVSADQIPDAIGAMLAVGRSGSPDDAASLGTTLDLAMDIRAYFEEAAIELAAHVPGARATETWLYQTTATGRVMLAAKFALRDAGHHMSVWWGMTPWTQEPKDERERSWKACEIIATEEQRVGRSLKNTAVQEGDGRAADGGAGSSESTLEEQAAAGDDRP